MSASALEIAPQRALLTSAVARVGYPLLFASGFAGLGYELVWASMLGAGLGHEVAAVLAVVAAFFVGLSLGGLWLGPRIDRSTTPALWYVGLELVIAVWAALLIVLTPVYNEWVPRLIGAQAQPLVHGMAAFLSALLLLLPATLAMGGTLAAMERVFRDRAAVGQVSGLYAANTLGAVVGVLGVTYALVPLLGFSSTLLICATVNLLCALVAWICFGSATPQSDRAAAQATAKVPALASHGQSNGPDTLLAGLSTRRLSTTLFATGFLGLGYEVVVVRVLSQVLEDTVYTFAGVLSVYLLGTAAGAGWQQYRHSQGPGRWQLEHYLLFLTTLALIGAATLWLANDIFTGVSARLTPNPVNGLLIDFALAALVFAGPTFGMGALFGFLSQQLLQRVNLGQVIAVNTLGSAIAPLLCGVLLLPALGAKWMVLLLAAGYLLLLPRWHWLTLFPVALAIGLGLSPPLRHVDVPESWTLLDYDEGVLAAVAVVEDPQGTRHLKVNNHFTMGSTNSGFADHRQTHLPLLLHPHPRSALFLGVGTGMSLSAAQYHPDLQVTAVELLPEALQKLAWFDTAPEQNDWPLAPTLVASDARRFVLSTDASYDVIIADLFHPSRDGAGGMFSVEHFSAIRERLSADGLFVQWLPLFQMDLQTFELIARTFADVFGEAAVYLPHFSLQQPVVGLLGRRQSQDDQTAHYQAGYLEQRVLDRRLQQALVQVRMNADTELFGGYLGSYTSSDDDDPAALNTDNWPRVTYRAPEFAYRRQLDHGARLVALVDQLRASRTAQQFVDAGAGSLHSRLPDYWAARDLYLEAGLGVSPDMSADELFAKTTEPLLRVVALSSEFQAAYMPLLALARSSADSDPARARALLQALYDAAPERREARDLLRRLP